MLKLRLILIIFIFSMNISASLSADPISDNRRFNIQKLVIKGQKYLSYSIINSYLKIDKGEYYYWEILDGVNRLFESGFLKSKPEFSIKHIKDKYYSLHIKIEENFLINTINILNKSDINIRRFLYYLEQNNIVVNSVVSEKAIQSSIRNFLLFYQKKGIFLLEIEYSVLKVHNMKAKKLIFVVKRIQKCIFSKITIKGVKQTDYNELVDVLKFKIGVPITKNSTLQISYRKFNRKGIFINTFFNLKPLKNKPYYKLIIETEELEKEILSFSSELPVNIGLIVTAGYANYSMGGTMRRLKVKLGYETKLDRLVGFAEYVIPRAWDKYLFGIRVQMHDELTPFNEQFNKLSTIFSFRISAGIEVFDFFDATFFLLPRYILERGRKIEEESDLIPPEELKNSYFENPFGIIFKYDKLNSNFYPTRGYKASLRLNFTAAKLSYFETITHAEIYFPLFKNTVLAAAVDGEFIFRDDTDATLFLHPRRRTEAQAAFDETVDENLRTTFYSAVDIRYTLNELARLFDEDFFENLHLISFFESGGHWTGISKINPDTIGYGVGIGLRYAPKSLYDLAFEFPVSVNLGYKIGKGSLLYPSFTIVTHRSDTYFLDLTVAF